MRTQIAIAALANEQVAACRTALEAANATQRRAMDAVADALTEPREGTMDPDDLRIIKDGHECWVKGTGGFRLARRGTNFAGCDFADACLTRAMVSGGDFTKANLRGADLRGAILTGACFWGADLSGADLRQANLRGADLRQANLRGADLDGAMLGGADLLDAELDPAATKTIEGAMLADMCALVERRPALAERVRVVLDAALMQPGASLRIRDRDTERTPPPGGALLIVTWAVDDQSYTDWYATPKAALQAMEALRDHERGHYVGEYAVDFTSPGCHHSGACVAARD